MPPTAAAPPNAVRDALFVASLIDVNLAGVPPLVRDCHAGAVARVETRSASLRAAIRANGSVGPAQRAALDRLLLDSRRLLDMRTN